MENKEIITLERGQTTFDAFFIWVREKLVRNANKLWTVVVPPGSGVAVFRDSKDRVVLDLSGLSFGGSSIVVEGTTPIVVTPVTADGVTTYTVSLDTDYAPRTITVMDANGAIATMDVLGTEPVEL